MSRSSWHRCARLALSSIVLASVLTVVGVPTFTTVQRAAATTDSVDLVPSDDARRTTGTVEDDEFDLLGIHLDTAPSEPVMVRTRSNDVWGEWTEVGFDDDHGPDPDSAEAAAANVAPGVVSDPVWVGDADAYEVNAPTEVQRADVVVVREQTERVVVDTQPLAADASANQPPINDRDAWNARAPAGGFGTASSITRAIVHHTAGTNNYNPSDVPAMLRSIQAYHIDGNGWSDIGYNFLVDKWGGIWEGRAGSIESLAVGAHAGGYNTGSVGVAAMGNHVSVVPSNAQLNGISSIVAWKITVGGGSASTPIIGHSDVGSTSCPGAQLYSRLPNIRSQVAAALSGDAEPVGSFASITPGPRTVRVTGWAADPDTTQPIQLHAYVNGSVRGLGYATLPRTDMGAIAGTVGTHHGFDVTIESIPAGRNEVCLYAINATPNAPNPLLGCKNVTIGGPPTGSFTGLRYWGGSQLSATGWAFDRDTSRATVRFAVDGKVVPDTRTSRRHTGISGAYSTFGTTHGYDVRLPVSSSGPHEVCGFVLDTGGSAHRFLGCRSVVVPPGEPYGAIDAARGGPDGTLVVEGWAHDPDTSGPGSIDITVDGRHRYRGVTKHPRPDVERFFSTAGPRHGFRVSVGGLSPGNHTVCVTSRNRYLGARSTPLGCRTVAIDGGSPFGSLDSVTSPSRGTARVTGWVIDPDVSSPATVHVYDIQPNKGFNIGPARNRRADVAAVFPRWGADHGFDATISGLSRGGHLLCAYGIDVGLGSNKLIGCAFVNVR